jgi:hypothetical protein
MLLYRYSIQRCAPQTSMALLLAVVCCEYRHLPLLAVLLRVAPCFTCLLVDLVLSYKPLYLERGQWVCTLWCGGSLGLCQVYVPEQ